MTVVAWLILALVAVVLALALGLLRLTAARRRAIAEPLHELRGALTAIQLGTSLLDNRAGGATGLTAWSDAVRTQLERASAAVEELHALFSPSVRLRAAEDRLVDVGSILRRRAAAWDRLATARRGAVELRWPIAQALVRGDPKHLCRALDNLIANGLEHGGGVVTLEGVLDQRVVRITVSDDGRGLDRPIQQLPRAALRARRGHGLAITRRAIELYGGKLRTVNAPHGAAVEIELPLAEPATRARSAGGPAPASSRLPAGARGAP
jgi:signal transduction histidine kinase